jgi:hypothetical protein
MLPALPRIVLLSRCLNEIGGRRDRSFLTVQGESNLHALPTLNLGGLAIALS